MKLVYDDVADSWEGELYRPMSCPIIIWTVDDSSKKSLVNLEGFIYFEHNVHNVPLHSELRSGERDSVVETIHLITLQVRISGGGSQPKIIKGVKISKMFFFPSSTGH